ncbi:MAG: ribose-phosphate pyrophosphokinase [Nitrososphaerales archaeon]
MPDWLIAPGPASRELGEEVARRLGLDLLDLELTIFPDGESKIKIKRDVQRSSVVVIQSTYPPVDRNLMQLLFIAHKLSEMGAEVYAFVPYLAYARQDKEFLKGEVVSIAVVARLMRAAGIKRLDTVDIHSINALAYFAFPAHTISAIPLLAEYLKTNYSLREPIVVSPDLGGAARAEGFASILKTEHLILKKARDRVTGDVSVEDIDVSLEGRDAVLVDDIISTGRSIEKAATLLYKKGVKKVYAACTHPLLLGDALQRLAKADVEIIGTNTVPSVVSKVDVAPLCASHLSTICT